MDQQVTSVVYKFRFVFAALFVLLNLLLLSMLVSAIGGSSTEAESYRSHDPTIISLSDDPNVIASGMVTATNGLIRSADASQAVLSTTAQSLATQTTAAIDFAANTSKTVASATLHGGIVILQTSVRVSVGISNGIHYGVVRAGSWSSQSIAATILMPFNTLAVVSNTGLVSHIIRPADHAAVPVIDPNSPELARALAALPATPTVPAASVETALWPLHGSITTEFGVPEPPYQPIHTGIDISDGQRSGVTPIRPFRHGTVASAIRGGGLGNHVIVDHGNGVTSVYGHLSDISVSPGQAVDASTILGYEGSTGVSTGTHLHFEIRVNGQATNPHLFISGQP